MLHLLFPVDYSLIDVFISQSEEFCNRNDQFLHGFPYPFRNGQFQGILGYAAHRVLMACCRLSVRRRRVQ